jgi:hypothetical protein
MRNGLALLAEGEGDVEALPVLVSRLLGELGLESDLRLSLPAIKTGGLHVFSSERPVPPEKRWTRFLKHAGRRYDTGAVLLVLDGDADRFEREAFCPKRVAEKIVAQALAEGAGRTFSFAVVFAVKEYESWLLAGVESLAGREHADTNSSVRPDAEPPKGDIERRADGTPRASWGTA